MMNMGWAEPGKAFWGGRALAEIDDSRTILGKLRVDTLSNELRKNVCHRTHRRGWGQRKAFRQPSLLPHIF